MTRKVTPHDKDPMSRRFPTTPRWKKQKSISFFHWDGSSPLGTRFPPITTIFISRTNPTDPVLPVYAPGGGVINKILLVPMLNVQECKVWAKMNDNFMYYLDHIVPHDSLKEGTTIHAGQNIGTTGLGTSIDLGVID
jgi:hypothetical protein